MIKFYKIIIPFLALLVISLFSIWRTSELRCNENFEKLTSTYEKRAASLFSSNTLLKRKLDLVRVKEIVSNNDFEISFQDTTIAILLSEFKCNGCQEKELKRMMDFGIRLKEFDKNIRVIGITAESQKNAVIRQRKTLGLSLPIYYTDDKTFYSRFNFYKEFPQIIIVQNNIIQSCFFPISFDDKFSHRFYENLETSFNMNQ